MNAARSHIGQKRKLYEKRTKPKLDQKLEELSALREKQLGLFEDFPENLDENKLTRTQLKQKRQIDFINDTFKNAQDYVREVYELGKEPFIQVVAVFCGEVMGQLNVSDPSSKLDKTPRGLTGLLF